jgi:hypothetical protein
LNNTISDTFVDTVKIKGFLSPKARQVSNVIPDQFRTPKSNSTRDFSMIDNMSTASAKRHSSKFRAQEAVVNKIFNTQSHKRLTSPETKA